MELESLIAADRLLGLQETYTGPLGIAGSIIAPGGRRITPESNRRRLCSLLCRSEHFQACCGTNDRTACDAAQSEVTIYRTDCCGLTDVAVPLSIGPDRAGTLLFGLVRTAPSTPDEAAELVDGYLARAPDLDDREELEAALAAVPVVDAELLHSSATLLREFADHIADLAARALMESELQEARRRARDTGRAHAFLAAALNTLAELAVIEHADEAHGLVVALARASRYAAAPHDAATIEDEVAHALDCLEIRGCALGDGLRFAARVEPSVEHVLVPRLSVRTLLDELLWRHVEAGMERPIQLAAFREHGGAVVEVVAGVLAEHPPALAGGGDLEDRLRRLHGEGCSVESERDGESLRARIRVPQGIN